MPELSANALRVLKARCLRRDAAGHVVETPEELFLRVARAVAQAELLMGTAREADDWQDVFASLLASLDFLPNSPALMNAGTPLGQLSACFVLPVEDSMESIFGALRAMALVQRTGGGSMRVFAGTSASIEPLFALAYLRHHSLGGPPLAEINTILLRYIEQHGLDSDRVLGEIVAAGPRTRRVSR